MECRPSVAFNFEDIQSRCDTYKDQISSECRELIQNATQQAQEIRKKAQAEGHSKGYRNGLKQAETEITERSKELADQMVEQRLSTVLPAVSKLLDEIVSARSHCQAEWESELVDLSTGIARETDSPDIRRNAGSVDGTCAGSRTARSWKDFVGIAAESRRS